MSSRAYVFLHYWGKGKAVELAHSLSGSSMLRPR